MKKFLSEIKSGIKYGFYFLIISFIMGLLYGILAGVPLETARVAAAITGLFVTMNFIIAVIALLPFVVSLFIGKQKVLRRYTGLSAGFMIVFCIYFLILKVV